VQELFFYMGLQVKSMKVLEQTTFYY